jgi:hypothetical protein
MTSELFDKAYTDSAEHPWGIKPATVVEEYKSLIQHQGNIIDLGAGDGRDSYTKRLLT